MKMADQGFPQTHTTTTTTATTVTIASRPYLDISYLQTLPGIVKVVQAVLDFICFICVVAGPYASYGGAGWGTFVSIVAFIITLILLIMYLFHMIEIFNFVPWLLVEMLYCALWTFFYLIAASVLAAASSRWGVAAYGAFAEMVYCFIWVLFYFIASAVLVTAAFSFPNAAAYGVAGFFGFLAMIAYGFDCFLKFRSWRNGEIAQGLPPGAGNPNMPPVH